MFHLVFVQVNEVDVNHFLELHNCIGLLSK
jgi:hypothetical protein